MPRLTDRNSVDTLSVSGHAFCALRPQTVALGKQCQRGSETTSFLEFHTLLLRARHRSQAAVTI
jgi:hypothetical protein